MRLDYREILKNELEQRVTRNPSYSLRAFAKAIHLAPPHLSAVLNGRKGLSKSSAAKIALSLNWNDDEKNIFISLVEVAHARKSKEKILAQERLNTHLTNKSFSMIGLDEFKIISDWYHLAILQLFELEGFKSDVKWIADKLNISKDEAEAALGRLRKLGFIEKPGSSFKLSKKNVATPAVPSSAIRSYHHQMLRKAGEALESQSIDERDFSSIVMPIQKSQLPEAKEWIKDFRRKFSAHFEKTKAKDEVYCLSVQFYKISNENKKQ